MTVSVAVFMEGCVYFCVYLCASGLRTILLGTILLEATVCFTCHDTDSDTDIYTFQTKFNVFSQR